MQETTAHESQSHKPQSAAARWAGGVGRILIKWVLGIAAAVAGLLVLTWKAAHGGGKSTAEDAAAAAAAGSTPLKTTLAGGGMLTFGGVTANDFAMLAGVVIGGLGLLWQVVLGWRKDQRERREHEARMRQLDGQCDAGRQ